LITDPDTRGQDMNPPPDDSDAQDSTTIEWFGQSVESDTELAERLSEEHDPDEAEELFDEQARGADVERRRRGDHIDPDLGEAAYHEERPGHAADPD
jgi:hypothetical protein